MPKTLPPCGLYRTLRPVAGVPENHLVYFHNHGDPGPGIYLPTRWKENRASFEERGRVLADLADVSALEAVAAEGLYRVVEPFHCCEKKCRLYEADVLVQLGYDASAQPILFSPEIRDGLLVIPERGTRIDRERIAKLARLRVPIATGEGAAREETLLH